MTITKTLVAVHDRVELTVEVLGPETGEPMLMIMGTGGQLIDWPDGFCEALVAAGFRIARFDNRDAGLSTRFTDAPRPNQLTMLRHPEREAAYTLEDMAGDALAVMDLLGWSSAHVVGISLGGMIAQVLATTHPERVRSLVSIGSTPSAKIGKPGIRTLLRIVRAANPRRVKTRDDLAQYVVDLDRVAGSRRYPRPEAELREHGRRAFDRGGLDEAGVQRQTAAIAAAGDRRAQLAAVTAPTLVIHGDADQMVLPSGGQETAAAISGARLLIYPDMAHGLPRELWPEIVAEIGANAARAGSPRTSSIGE